MHFVQQNTSPQTTQPNVTKNIFNECFFNLCDLCLDKLAQIARLGLKVFSSKSSHSVEDYKNYAAIWLHLVVLIQTTL